MDQETLRLEYTKAALTYSALAEKEERRLFIISIIRLAVFAGGFILSWLAFTSGIVPGILTALFMLSLFLWLVKIYMVHSSEKEYLKNLSGINAREAAVVSGDFSSLDQGSEYADAGHPFSNDIDLFGPASLFQYINRTVTGLGRDMLAGWLSEPFLLASELVKRQQAIKELSAKAKWRQDFQAQGMTNPLEKKDLESVISWIADSKSSIRGIHRYLIVILPVATLIALSLLIAGLLHYSIFTSLITINLLYVFSGIRNTGRLHTSLSKKYLQLESMNRLICLFENERFDSEIMISIRSGLAGKEFSAAEAVGKLGKIIRAFDNRLNLIVGIALNGLLLWDYQCIWRLEKWKRKYRDTFSIWLEMLGITDAFISLAGYAFNNQGYVFPVIADNGTVLAIKSGGHPLLNSKERVCNDFKITANGQVCVITGANMAGKSTFLRTVSVNLVLAMSGAPVCAGSMTFRPVKLFTSMRTTDSLSGHESYFYAELRRLGTLKNLVQKGEPVLFILDEILKGTNSGDKSLGSKLFIKKLIEHEGTGIIATHDLSLGDLEKEYKGTLFNKCFEVEIDNDRISFDYILRDGITRKMNAAILMKQMGILD